MKKLLVILFIFSVSTATLIAGNKDRAGQAGAYELLINPWARSSGWNGLITANVKGLESINQNVAGLSFTKGTEVLFSRSIYLQGTDININAFGFSQEMGKKGGVLGINIMAMTFGDIQITTTDKPEGGIGTYRPQFLNIGIAYAKTFSKSISGGFVLRGISESASDITATGFSVDAGIQYVTNSKGKKDNIHFGISLRNIGTPMKFRGDALSFKTDAPEGNYPLTIEKRSQQFELPSMLNIGGAYDFRFGGTEDDFLKRTQRITIAANFTSNSFYRDQIGGGLEYSFKEQFMFRGGYNYQTGLTSTLERSTAFTGLSFGATIEVPLNKAGTTFGLDYSYRTSNPFGGTHSIGIRLTL
jgi:hypothetical protein